MIKQLRAYVNNCFVLAYIVTFISIHKKEVL